MVERGLSIESHLQHGHTRLRSMSMEDKVYITYIFSIYKSVHQVPEIGDLKYRRDFLLEWQV